MPDTSHLAPPSRPHGAVLTPPPRLRPVAPGWRATPATATVAGLALERIWYPWQELLPGWALHFRGRQPGFLGRTIWPDRVIEIYVRPGQHPEDVAFALAHELGHAVDLELLDPTGRAGWRRRRGLPGHLEWFGASDENDFATPAGDWAECFAAWQVGPIGFQSQLGGIPDRRQRALLSTLSHLAPTGERRARTRRQGDEFPISRLKATG